MIGVVTTQEVLEVSSVCRKPTAATTCPTTQPPTRRDALVSNFTMVSVILLRVCKGDHYPSGLEALVVYQPIMDFS